MSQSKGSSNFGEMNKTITPEMISAFVDGELSPEDKLSVENALLVDEHAVDEHAADSGAVGIDLREIADGFQALRSSIRSSSEFTASTVHLPKQFTSKIMGKIMGKIHQLSEPVDQEMDGGIASKFASEVESKTPYRGVISDKSELNRPASLPGFYSIRTLLEVLVATAAVLLIVVNWPSAVSDSGGTDSDSIAKNAGDPSLDLGNVEKKSGVKMLSVGDGKKVITTSKNGGTGATQPAEETNAVNSSREFSIFVNESARPSIDRFWIMKSYEVNAPEQEPDGRVNMLLIDAKKADAVKFFGDLKKWDANFKVFQDSGKSPNATWLAPFDASKIEAAEGDFWKLRIVLIAK